MIHIVQLIDFQCFSACVLRMCKLLLQTFKYLTHIFNDNQGVYCKLCCIVSLLVSVVLFAELINTKEIIQKFSNIVFLLTSLFGHNSLFIQSPAYIVHLLSSLLCVSSSSSILRFLHSNSFQLSAFQRAFAFPYY